MQKQTKVRESSFLKQPCQSLRIVCRRSADIRRSVRVENFNKTAQLGAESDWEQ